MFYDKFVSLCKERGISPSAAVEDIGIRKSNVTYWKKGRNNPSNVTLKKIADYFGITVDYFENEPDTKEKTATPKDDGLSEAELELVKLFRVFSEDEKTRILEYVRTVLQIAEANRKLDALRIPGTNEILLK